MDESAWNIFSINLNFQSVSFLMQVHSIKKGFLTLQQTLAIWLMNLRTSPDANFQLKKLKQIFKDLIVKVLSLQLFEKPLPGENFYLYDCNAFT